MKIPRHFSLSKLALPAFLVGVLSLATTAASETEPPNLPTWRAGVQEDIHRESHERRITAEMLDGGPPAAIIQAAFDRASPPATVILPAGEWTLHQPLQMRPGVVLRGSGKLATRLIFDLPEPSEDGGVRPALGAIQFAGQRDAEPVALLGDPAAGDNQVEVAAKRSIKIGDTALIFSENDPQLMYTDPRWDRDWARQSLAQIVAITGVDGNQLTLDTGLRLDFDPKLNPRIQILDPIEQAGLENLYLERIDGVSDNIIGIETALNCWVRDCETVRTGRGHIWINYSRFVTISGNRCHEAISYGGGGNGYGIVAGNIATDCLIENNELHTLRHSLMAKRGSNGNVFAYNYSHDRRREDGKNLLCDISLHGHYPYQNLFEGNVVEFVELADYWGPTGPHTTFFRNHVSTRFQISDHSDETIVWNNVLPPEGIRDDGTSTDLFLAHNGTPTIAEDDGASATVLPQSLFYSAAPTFWDSTLAWPMPGPDEYDPTSDAPANPAAARAQARLKP
jgi:hypothetical protein